MIFDVGVGILNSRFDVVNGDDSMGICCVCLSSEVLFQSSWRKKIKGQLASYVYVEISVELMHQCVVCCRVTESEWLCFVGQNLWICLICGFVGCGRYVEGHAYGHFKETSHTYSMELGSSRVWDYAGDNYVHRLVQNKADGKLVEVDEQSAGEQEEKIDALNLEVDLSRHVFTVIISPGSRHQQYFICSLPTSYDILYDMK